MTLREKLEEGCEEEIEQWKPYSMGGPTLTARLDGARLALEAVFDRVITSSDIGETLDRLEAMLAELKGEE